MASQYTDFTEGELWPNPEKWRMLKRLQSAGYTPDPSGIMGNNDGDPQTYTVTVEENGVSRADLLTALMTAEPSLSFSKTAAVVMSDGVDTDQIVITDSRGAAAQGNTVTLKWKGIIHVNSKTHILDANGQATIVFGPCPMGENHGEKTMIEVHQETPDYDPRAITVEFV